jgi:hypothetical protein
LFVLVGLGCGQSINASSKADVDKQIASLQRSSKSYEAPASFEPMPLATGQWAKYKLVDEEGHPSIATYKVVGEEAGAHWIEFEQETYYGENVTLMLANLGDRRDPDTIKIHRLKTRNDGTVQEQPPQVLGLMKSMWKPILSNLVIHWERLPQQPASVPAGTFARCYKQRTTVSFVGISRTSDTWAHPAVPMSGTVKSVGVDKPFTMELIDFGLTGASSSIGI